MQGLIKSIVAGAVSGTATYFVSITTLGYTNAFVMPSWASLALWEMLVVFGLGAALVSLLIHLAALRVFLARVPLAFVSFFGTTLLALAVTGQLSYGVKALVAWAVGAVLASLAYRKLRPNNTFKPTPLRGAA